MKNALFYKSFEKIREKFIFQSLDFPEKEVKSKQKEDMTYDGYKDSAY